MHHCRPSGEGTIWSAADAGTQLSCSLRTNMQLLIYSDVSACDLPSLCNEIPHVTACWQTTCWRTACWRTACWRTACWRTACWRTVSWRTVSWRTVSWRTACWRTACWRTAAEGLSADGLPLFSACYLSLQQDKSNTGLEILDYVVMVSPVVLAWVETWLLDLKVLPHEKKEYERSKSSSESIWSWTMSYTAVSLF